MNDTLRLAVDLIKRRSITPHDDGCQSLIAERLAAKGFDCEILDKDDVRNIWLRRGREDPLFVFAGHTDVVPVGEESAWRYPPFAAHIENDLLYGRGAADMKGGVAAMVTACEAFVEQQPEHIGSIAMLLTSNEEGYTRSGTAYAIDALRARGVDIRWCVVGEPSSSTRLGDTVKNGRRGSLSAKLTVIGKQGHVAYPQFAENPIHLAAPVLSQLCRHQWDEGNEYFPPTTFQISNIHAGSGADNVIPERIEIEFNLRFSTESTAEQLQDTILAKLKEAGLNYEIEWYLSGHPFLTAAGELTAVVGDAITEIVGIEPQLSTAGGTSDARFIATADTQVIELGHINKTIHAVDEHIRVDDLQRLSDIYSAILKRLLGTRES